MRDVIFLAGWQPAYPADLQQYGEGEQKGEDEDVSGGVGKGKVEVSASALVHTSGGKQVYAEINAEKGCPDGVAQQMECNKSEGNSNETERHIKPEGRLTSDEDDQSAFVVLSVLFDITVVVDNQEIVGNEAVGDGAECDRQRPFTSLKVISEANGYDAEENEDEDVAHGDVGEKSAVEETEDDAGDADADEPPTSIVGEGKSDKAGNDSHHPKRTAHGFWGYPA